MFCNAIAIYKDKGISYILHFYKNNTNNKWTQLIKQHINEIVYYLYKYNLNIPNELKFTGPTEEDSWVNYKNIYKYTINKEQNKIFLNKPL